MTFVTFNISVLCYNQADIEEKSEMQIREENEMSEPILDWNEVALEANKVSHTNGLLEQTGPPLSARALAIVHLAMYDAYAGVNPSPSLPPYLSGLPAPGAGASASAAIAAAAHATLSDLYRSQRPYFDAKLAALGDVTDPGHTFGIAVAQAILNDRRSDPGIFAAGYVPPMQRGDHRPDPDNPDQGFHGPYYGKNSKGFGITKRFELAAPPLDTPDYRDAVREVRGRGIAPELMGTLPNQIKGRTVDQMLIGIFWAYDGRPDLGTPPRFYNQIVREVASHVINPQTGAVNTTAENARLFAFVNVALADAGILAWEQKYFHHFWRPILGVREHDHSLGTGATQANDNIINDSDPFWLPLGSPQTNGIGKNFTPPFPAYPSGHATFGAAAFQITRLFYGQGGKFSDSTLTPDMLFDGLEIISEELDGHSKDNRGTVRTKHRRNFPGGLWQMIEENGRSRVYLGVHWVFDAFMVASDNSLDLDRTDNGLYYGGVPLGLQIAEDCFAAGMELAPKKSTV